MLETKYMRLEIQCSGRSSYRGLKTDGIAVLSGCTIYRKYGKGYLHPNIILTLNGLSYQVTDEG